MEVIFLGKRHEEFFQEQMQRVQCNDVYHRALIYCLGISEDTRRNIDQIYDFETGCINPECLTMGWQTSGSLRVIRLAFNLYCNGTPTVNEEADEETQISECQMYAVDEIFCCSYAPYFWQAVKIRYPEYTNENY